MIRTVCLLALAAYVSGQYRGDSRDAAILTDSRYLNGDGKFGSSYSQEDGVEFKEETDADGTRRGSYSYVDPSGQRKTVSYTAGKNGFQATGSHLPVGPHQLGVAPTPDYVPLPQYNSPQQQQQQPAPRDYNPQPSYQPQPAYNPQPAYRQPQPAYRQPQPAYRPPQPAYNPPQPVYTPQPQPQPQPQAAYRATTPAPHRFFPPGKLSLNRSPDGFSYTFNKA